MEGQSENEKKKLERKMKEEEERREWRRLWVSRVPEKEEEWWGQK